MDEECTNRDSRILENLFISLFLETEFVGIYSRPDHMQTNSEESKQAEDTEMIDDMIAAVEE